MRVVTIELDEDGRAARAVSWDYKMVLTAEKSSHDNQLALGARHMYD